MSTNEEPINEDLEFDEALFEDQELIEIQTQLLADAQHLAETYPSASNCRMEQLILQCQAQVAQESNAVVPAGQIPSDVRSARRWYPIAFAFSIGFLVVGSFALMGNWQANPMNEQPVVSNREPTDVEESPPLTVSSMPKELLNASQPELEAIYDQMGLVSVSAEF